MEESARMVANIVTNVSTDTRGEFLLKIAEDLKRRGQGFTAELFGKIAIEYGI